MREEEIREGRRGGRLEEGGRGGRGREERGRNCRVGMRSEKEWRWGGGRR